MTVQELIDILNQVENKEIKVKVPEYYGGSFGVAISAEEESGFFYIEAE